MSSFSRHKFGMGIRVGSDIQGRYGAYKTMYTRTSLRSTTGLLVADTDGRLMKNGRV
jgi:hypothetical protein